MANWIVKNHHRKSVEELEYFKKDRDGEVIICSTNWRWGSWSVETSDENPPEFEFNYFPNGDGKKDCIDMYNCLVNNIENVQLIETIDGGYDIEYPATMSQDEQDRLQERIDEEGVYSILEDEEGYYHSGTECWVCGPIEILDENNHRIRVIVADENGNVIDYKED